MLVHFLKDPRTIGTVAPSSPFLAKAMAAQLTPFPTIVEIGAGTGAITRHLQKYPNATLLIFEFHPHLLAQLKQKINHPNALFFHGPVHLHRKTLMQFSHSPMAIVSCLPFKSLPSPIASQTEQLYLDLLAANPSSFVRQFSYTTLRKYAPPTRHLPWIQKSTIYANVPPATLWETHTPLNNPTPPATLYTDNT